MLFEFDDDYNIDTTLIDIYSFDYDYYDVGGVYMNKEEIKNKAIELIKKLDMATEKGDKEEIQKVSKEIVDFLLLLTELE